MQNEIEVGEYVRTDKGYLFKVDKEKTTLKVLNFLDVEYGNIVKHSKQLIDLIDFGDFVNGINVVEKGLDKNDNVSSFSNGHDEVRAKDIKTILTKERYMVNCYKVGGRE